MLGINVKLGKEVEIETMKKDKIFINNDMSEIEKEK